MLLAQNILSYSLSEVPWIDSNVHCNETVRLADFVRAPTCIKYDRVVNRQHSKISYDQKQNMSFATVQ